MREILTWEQFGVAGRELAELVDADGFSPDLILSIARGGLFVAGALGYALDVKNLHVMNIEFYTGVDERLDMPVMLPPVPNVVDLAGARVQDARFDGADLRGARVDPTFWTSARLRTAKVDLEQALGFAAAHGLDISG